MLIIIAWQAFRIGCARISSKLIRKLLRILNAANGKWRRSYDSTGKRASELLRFRGVKLLMDI